MKGKKIFLDGKMIEADNRLLNSLVPGAVKRQGVFETMLVRNGKIEGIEEHLRRLVKGLKVLRMRPPYSQKQMERHLECVLKANALIHARIRLSVWKEGGCQRVAVVCAPFKGHSREKYKKGFKAVVASARRKKTRLAHVKSLDYGVFREAFLEAKKMNCDEAILLNNKNEMVEGSRTNIFFAKNGVLYTPAIYCGALNGITRRRVIRRARKKGIPFRAVAAELSRLLGADEAFVTNSLIGVMPLSIVNGRRIGSGSIGPITKKLLFV